ncbi:MAG: NAD(+) synthase [Clostridia bacterium]|nr:NAD(+) synthase [Clostridia bacterium]
MRFDAKREAENVINFVKDYYKKNHLKGAVIGISGGKDSAVVAAIMVKAIGKENVVGVTLPCHSKEEDRKDAILVAKHYGIELVNIDLTNSYDAFKDEIEKLDMKIAEKDLVNSDINIKPRLRMSAEYYLAAMYSSLKGGTYLVIGTSNKSELYVGYFTKGGDQVHDIEVLSDFTVSEVIKIGEYLKVPKKVLYKAPSDGLSGKTDEDKLGVTYDDIEKYIYAQEMKDSVKEKIRKLHDANKHKFNMPAYKRKRVGVFVGTFDPVHKGHTHVIKYILEHNIVDKVIVIPTGSYWNKAPKATTKQRIDMLKFIANDKIEISTKLNDIEYTYQIMEELEKEYPMDYLYLIIGADNIIKFDEWKNVNKLLEYNIIVVNRDNINIKKYVNKFNKKDNFFVIDNFDYVPISSTEIRQNVDSKEAKKYLDERVLKYIKNNNLYK